MAEQKIRKSEKHPGDVTSEPKTPSALLGNYSWLSMDLSKDKEKNEIPKMLRENTKTQTKQKDYTLTGHGGTGL